MKIEYGPPGTAGVKNLQYLSGIPTAETSCALPIAKIAGVVWLGAKIFGKKPLKRYAFWAGLGALALHFAQKSTVPLLPPGTG